CWRRRMSKSHMRPFHRRQLEYLRRSFEAGSAFAPLFAIQFCREKRIKNRIPEWALDAVVLPAIHEALKNGDVLKSRRWQQAMQDRDVHAAVLDARANGLTLEKSYEHAAASVTTFDGTVLTTDRAKNAYIRVLRKERGKTN